MTLARVLKFGPMTEAHINRWAGGEGNAQAQGLIETEAIRKLCLHGVFVPPVALVGLLAADRFFELGIGTSITMTSIITASFLFVCMSVILFINRFRIDALKRCLRDVKEVCLLIPSKGGSRFQGQFEFEVDLNLKKQARCVNECELCVVELIHTAPNSEKRWAAESQSRKAKDELRRRMDLFDKFTPLQGNREYYLNKAVETPASKP